MVSKQTVVITGSARRLGREIALSLADEGYSIVLHSTAQSKESENTLADLRAKGVHAKYIAADLNHSEAAAEIFSKAFSNDPSIFALINNAAIFEGAGFLESNLDEWERNLNINLTAPYLLSKRFAESLGSKPGRIINMLDWRSLRPGRDHFSYTVSKAALASMTKAMALALAPDISVNGLALGAILPPADLGPNLSNQKQISLTPPLGHNESDAIIRPVPAGRWAKISEVTDTIKFLISGPAYITGEIIHIDGGRHLV
jgi:NAD(P)-dependent dehydrogenase (short-subunit alcohol dehydrogenase family)